MIDDITIQRILDTARIDEVVSEFVSLKRRGANYTGLCPFHNEKTPSFSVSPVKGIYKCFGCGKAGNSVNFLMEHEHITYPDALRWLAKKYHIDIQETEISAEEIARRDERESLYVATAFAQEFFMESLWKTEEGKAVGLEYFKEREFRDDLIKKFGLGYSPEKGDSFYKHAIKNGFKDEFLHKSGLINKANYDAFSGRVIFPLHNLSGRVVGFTGRILNKEKSPAKYYNSPESEIFHKGKILFGLFLAKKAIADKDQCYLVEGNADVVMMHQAGIENCVASSGTALTPDQIALIKRFTKNIVLLYDADPAGIKAALRGIDLLLEEGMHVKVVLLPEGEDPDSFARTHSSTELTEFLEKHEDDFFTFKTKVLLKDTGRDPVKRSEALNDIVGSLSLVPDTILRSLYIKECSLLMGIDEKLLSSEVAKRIIRKRYEPESYASEIVKTPATPQTPAIPADLNDLFAEEQEFEILRILFLYGNAVMKLKDKEGNIQEFVVLKYVVNELSNQLNQLKNLIYHNVIVRLNKQMDDFGYTETKDFIYDTDEKIQKLAADILNIPYYKAHMKGQSDTLSKYYERIGIHVPPEDASLAKAVPEVVIRYKAKIIENYLNEIREKIRIAEQVKASSEADDLLREYSKATSLLKEMYDFYGHVVRK